MVGVVGSSNNPVSGMTIATLLISIIIFKMFGMVGVHNIVVIFYIGIIICVVVSVSGVLCQSLKTGFLIGATLKNQQIGALIGFVPSVFISVAVINLLNKAWGFGSSEIPAPQANLIKLVVEGAMDGNLPWFLIFAGACIVIFVEVLGIPSMSFALGLFLPISLSVSIAIGGFIRDYFYGRDNKLSYQRENGVLFSSGLIAGDGLIGILLAVFAVLKINVALSGTALFNGDATIIFFVLLCLALLKFSLWDKK